MGPLFRFAHCQRADFISDCTDRPRTIGREIEILYLRWERAMNRRILCRALLVATLLTPLSFAAGQQDKSGWVDLLESKDLKTHWFTTGNWILKDGVVALEPRPGEKGWQRYDAYLWAK